MQYQLLVRAFLDVERKDKALSHARRLFSGLNPEVKGRYWKDESLWEVACERHLDYGADAEAVFETMKYFYEVQRQWIVTGPDEADGDTLLSGICKSDHVLHWCHYELLRCEA